MRLSGSIGLVGRRLRPLAWIAVERSWLVNWVLLVFGLMGVTGFLALSLVAWAAADAVRNRRRAVPGAGRARVRARLALGAAVIRLVVVAVAVALRAAWRGDAAGTEALGLLMPMAIDAVIGIAVVRFSVAAIG